MGYEIDRRESESFDRIETEISWIETEISWIETSIKWIIETIERIDELETDRSY